ncbi:DUF6177 family protein [Micromonospora yangpuensis]|uniref:Uncharacterized protein n=1 Tax=Micromonospora yangpuensis TaxID=683228 RepID=A0A1C6U250_9ACTN|nr:DUF6177 family protein [Micromonospora yangpuensis]GGM10437.1 hypothetical protein GCM10012279_30610 [Micromonospora yangpuensis]SCL48122.1 hypothetical protein GA0070617_0782 [Micromonospora yangpuensis]
MGEPLTGPTDTITDRAVVLHQDRPVVGLAPWLAEAAVDAVRDGLLLQVVTPADGFVTYPLEMMLTQARGQWVVRGGDHYRDGLTGLPLRWDGRRFSPADGSRPTGPPPAADPWTGGLEIQIVTLHPATEALELGASTEVAVRALTGDAPAGWGVAEPVSEGWSRRDLTSFCRTRAPAPTSLTIVGGERGSAVLGVLTIERVDTGVREQLRLAGPPLPAVGEAAVEALAGTLAGTARSVIVAVHPGRTNGLRSSRPSLPALPWGILVGQRGNAPHSVPEVVPGRAMGRGARRAWWYRLDRGPGAPYETLTAVLRGYGLDEPR